MIFDGNPYRLTRAATWGIAIFPVVLTGVMALLLTTDATRGFALRLSRENNVIEVVTAGLLLAGGASLDRSVATAAKDRAIDRNAERAVVFRTGLLLISSNAAKPQPE